MNTPYRDTKRPTYCNPFGLNSKSSIKCDISDSTLPFPDMLPSLQESGNMPVETHSGQAQESISKYTIDIKNKYVGQLYYEWSISANAEIIEPYDVHSETISVKTLSVNSETFTVTCIVTDDDRTETVEETYTHQRIEGENFLVVNAITETQAGSCSFDTTEECTAISNYTLDHTYVTNFEWIVEGGELISGQGTENISVKTHGDTDNNISILCKVRNSVSFDQISDNFVHNRTENVIPLPTITSINETVAGECDFESQSWCIALSSYTVNALNNTGIYWTLTSNDDVEMIGSIVSDEISVQSRADKDISFTLKAEVSNKVGVASIEQTFIHDRTEILILPVVMTSIDTITQGSCDWFSGNCQAIGEYKIIQQNASIFEWTIVGNATITSGQGTDTVLIETDSNIDEDFTLTCKASNSRFSDTFSDNFTHTHTQTFDTVNVSNLLETVSGYCEYAPLGVCLAESTYTVDATDYDTLVWDVQGGIIESGQGTTTIVVSSDSSIDVNLNISCIANGLLGGVSNVFGSFTHTRSELQDPVAITSLTELSAGSCEYTAGGTCEATSIYQVVGSDYESINWIVTGATIVSGQGTDTITVSSTDGINTTFNVKSTLTGIYGVEVSLNTDFNHTRTELQEEFDQTLLYDVNNIATEFVKPWFENPFFTAEGETVDGVTLTDNSVSGSNFMFDGFVVNDCATGSDSNYSGNGDYATLDHATPVEYTEIQAWCKAGENINNLYIQGSNDNTIWDTLLADIGTPTMVDCVPQTFQFEVSGIYRYYRVRTSTSMRPRQIRFRG